ncbi:MAG: nuclear transport factor 2 family protein [Alphaproteobacteria bacterium]|jgi:ketosteroid isomerase-like protein
MDFAQRLDRLESVQRQIIDREEIRRLISRYSRAIDEDIKSEQSAIFSEDVVSETRPWSAGREMRGKDAVLKSFQNYIATFANRRRFITNEQIDVTDENSATGWANWLVLHAHGDDSYCGWGVYDWGFARNDGVWEISRMIITVECMTTLKDGWSDAKNLIADYPGSKKV